MLTSAPRAAALLLLRPTPLGWTTTEASQYGFYKSSSTESSGATFGRFTTTPSTTGMSIRPLHHGTSIGSLTTPSSGIPLSKVTRNFGSDTPLVRLRGPFFTDLALSGEITGLHSALLRRGLRASRTD